MKSANSPSSESKVVFEKHSFSVPSHDEFEVSDTSLYNPKRGFAYYKDDCNLDLYSTLRQSDSDLIKNQLRSGRHLECTDLYHFSDDDIQMLESAFRNDFVDNLFFHDLVKIAILHLTHFGNEILAEELFCWIIRFGNEWSDIEEFNAEEFGEDDENEEIVKNMYRRCAHKLMLSTLTGSLVSGQRQQNTKI